MGKNSKTGDYSALLHIVADRKQHLWVQDSIIQRLPATQLEDTTALFIKEHEPQAVAIECNGFQEVVADNILLKSPGAPIYKFISKVDKEVRLRMTLTPFLASKRLHLRNTPANQLLLAQMRAFPTAQHDDGPDALSLAANQFAEMVKQVRRPPPQPTRLRV
jgi:predicted phage terminase large subunit-like protein